MTAHSMGAFGAYKYAYSRYLKEREDKEKERKELEEGPETVWVTKRYIPTDLRVTAPVPRHKLLAPKELPPAEKHWVPTIEPPLRSFDRGPEAAIFKSHPSTRCEEYSTLKQMIPSSGSLIRVAPPNWGTAGGVPIMHSLVPARRYPMINSPMTKYVDDMHTTNKLFKLH
ncbi:uncharacterized protein [Argopecten irradians]|uniref:uncharacterized protein n=1 Tax=Argopecten irradians TaxID=31199 RepID=UPI00371D061A